MVALKPGQRSCCDWPSTIVPAVQLRVATGEPSAALVLRDKAQRVQEFYAASSSARGSWRGPWSGRTRVSGGAHAAGRADGAQADLGQPGLRQRGQLGA